jgi:hypothetical protein
VAALSRVSNIPTRFLTKNKAGARLTIIRSGVDLSDLNNECFGYWPLALKEFFMLDHTRNFNDVFDEAVSAQREDKRGTRAALPADVLYYLNEVQRIALHSLENFGWQLAFIRRPLFMPPMVVVRNGEQTKYAVLEDDGSVNLSPQVKWRH